VAATFDLTLPTALDRIRRSVGDTNTAAALRQDEEILAVLTLTGDENLATAQVAAGLAVEYAQRPDSISDDGTSISWRERVKTWLTISESASALAVVAMPRTGVWTEKLGRFPDTATAEYDPDRVEPTW
jgi:hypothetical protein